MPTAGLAVQTGSQHLSNKQHCSNAFRRLRKELADVGENVLEGVVGSCTKHKI